MTDIYEATITAHVLLLGKGVPAVVLRVLDDVLAAQEPHIPHHISLRGSSSLIPAPPEPAPPQYAAALLRMWGYDLDDLSPQWRYALDLSETQPMGEADEETDHAPPP
jgi:hypothetical protein